MTNQVFYAIAISLPSLSGDNIVSMVNKRVASLSNNCILCYSKIMQT